ncbi:MAG: Holliday junction resolvase RuvX [Vicinamibacterales bacterium]
MRYVGVDFGKRRIGLAVSDDSAVLARPWETMTAGPTPSSSAERVSRRLAAFAGEDPDVILGGIIVGLPRKLNGQDTDLTAPTREFAERLEVLTRLRVHLQDERLTSHEAEQRLSAHERDWRVRKQKIDAVAAAIILQDFLDQPRPMADPQPEP